MSTDATRMSFGGGLIGTVLSERYRLDSKLGSGGMSTVFLARDETLERWVAVKVLHREISDEPDQIERFRQEARAVAQLSHPNLVAVIDAGEDGGYPYIVFEYIAGETLKDRIDRVGPLPLDEAVAYAIEIGRGLAAAHACRLVHRDVKPQNVLIDQEGRAKVTDFGIARSLGSDGGLTKTGRVLGTTDYVSPEQAMGHAIDARSDIYALGIVLYEMLTGDVPFKAETLVGVAMKHVNEPMPDVQLQRPEVSSILAAVVDRATAKDPAERYADMSMMLDDLEHALEVEVSRAGGAHGEATSVLDTVPKRRRLLTGRRMSLVGLLLVLAATAGALLIAGLTGNDSTNESAGSTAASKPVALVSAGDFDPPPGDGAESGNPKTVVDESPTTAWATEHYDSEDFGGLKDGVGIYVQAKAPVAAREMEVRSSTPGWDAQVYATDASTPPTSLTGWGSAIGDVSDASADTQIELKATAESRFFLLWLTKLPDPEFQTEIGDIRLFS